MHKINLFRNLLLLILSHLTVRVTAAGDLCPEDWQKNEENGQCYYVSKSFADFHAAKEICESKNSQIVSVFSFEDQAILIRMLSEISRSRECRPYDNCLEYWIDIIDFNGKQRWTSSNGTLISKENQFWASGSPRVLGRCVFLNLEDSKKDARHSWKNEICERPLKFICSALGSSATSRPVLPGSTMRKPNKYLIFTAKLNWLDAYTMCGTVGTGASLATITSDADNRDIVEFLKGEIEKGSSDCRSFWLGAQRIKPGDCNSPFAWKAQHGREFAMIYTHFKSGQPDCSYGESCIHTAEENKFEWNDLACDKALCSLCQLDPTL